jgi:hypothetical protein
MTALAALLRSEIRDRWRGLVVLAVLAGLAGGVLLATVAGGRRTATALDRFRADTNAADALVQTDDAARGRELLAAALAMPEVAGAAEAAVIQLGVDVGLAADPVLLVPTDGQYTQTIGRMRVIEGRLPDPTAADEVVVSEAFQSAAGTVVGDRLSLPTFTPDELMQVISGEGEFPGFHGPNIDAHVVGVVRVPEDAHGGAVNGGSAVTGTAALYDRYYGSVGMFEGSFGVDLHDPDDIDVLAARMREVAGEEAELFVQSADDGYAASGRDALRVMAYGLYAFGALAGLAALVVVGQASGRERQRSRSREPAWRTLGASRSQCVAAIVGPQALALTVAAVVAATSAFLASPFFPFGFARKSEPHPGVHFDSTVLLGGAALLTIIAIGGAVLAETLRTRGSDADAKRTVEGRWRPRQHVPVDLGVGLATTRGYGVSAALAVAVGLAGVVGAAGFSSDLHDLVDTPDRWGWTFSSTPDLEIEESDRDEVLAALAADPDVVDVAISQRAAVDVEGEQVSGVSLESPNGRPAATMLSGRSPGPGEVVVGERTLRRINSKLGDVVAFRNPEGGTEALTIVGTGAFPLTDNEHPGDGAWLAADALERLAVSDGNRGIALTYRDGVDVDDVEERLAREYGLGFSTYSHARLPGQIRNLDRISALGPTLGAFFAVIGIAGLAHALVLSVRRRRHDYAVVRALGLRPRDLSRSVRWQSYISVALGIVIGVPTGVLAGRLIWFGVVDDLGVDDHSRSSLPTIVATCALAAVVAALVAWLPSRRAAVVTGEALREE